MVFTYFLFFSNDELDVTVYAMLQLSLDQCTVQIVYLYFTMVYWSCIKLQDNTTECL